ncbi:dTDP-4-dehydrorhamnose reductase [Clostridium fallax]|uniref:dTDP-4-dehydrorhamnose reductase n=1 Tax=Clostridium fallax TaxID=1533 RepID=A0A1M4SXZ8_9CLOT|nr:dTDP-4-dehydrorhamnose reductase [Clostridium fallax]SHE37064.1 dTDP-4-dehydrorhamnose reductase [Clostridium fallax]SQB08025.1 dTDP-4-dehydrorhamnose reductase [Clostridium fallax]
MKILITGANGQLGTAIMKIIENRKCDLGNIPSEIKIEDTVGLSSKELDISIMDNVIKTFNEIKPDVVINCAAYTNVDKCESNEDIAFKVNALGARNLAKAAEKIGAKIIHISTDYVFNGEGEIFKGMGDKPLKEYDLTGPVSVYGKTKLMGEDFIRDFSTKYFIVRTAWLYGYYGNNFVYTIMKAGEEKGKLKVVDDQKGNPTNAEDLAYHILKLANTEEYGIYHCTGNGECTWYDFACKIIEYAKIDCKVSPCSSDEFKRPAKRPEFSSLDNMMLRCTIGDNMREWQEALKVFIENYKRFKNN